jgi:hypothetical protein
MYGKKNTSCSSGNLWKLPFVALGELQKSTYYHGHNSSASTVFNRQESSLDVADEMFYSFMCVTLEYIRDGSPDYGRGLGLPKWFKKYDFMSFIRSVYGIVSNPDHVASIMDVPNSKNKAYTEEDAYNMARYRDTKYCISYCRDNSPGVWLRGFKDEGAFTRSVSRLYDECVRTYVEHTKYGMIGEDEAKVQLKAHRLTEKVCERWARALAYLSCMSSRLGRPVDMHSSLQRDVFGRHYKLLREASMNLGWLVCVDDTYSPGSRCMTFQPRVCFDKTVKVDRTPRLNKAEAQVVSDLSRYSLKDVGKQHGDEVVQSVKDRVSYLEACTTLKDVATRVQSAYGKYLWRYGDDGTDIVNMQWYKSNELRQWQMTKDKAKGVCDWYRLKYSRPRQQWCGSVRLRVA